VETLRKRRSHRGPPIFIDRGAPLVLNGGVKSALGGFGVVSNGGRHDGVVMLICIAA
jgi:hypothetical protein